MVGLGSASVPVVKQYLRYVETLDIDIPALLVASRISAATLTEENERISGEQLQAFLANLIIATDDPLFGLKSGVFVEPSSYSVLGYITMTCATLAQVLERIQPYEKLVGDMGVTSIEYLPQQLSIHWHCAYTFEDVREQMVDNVFASWLAYARWLSGQDVGPLAVHLQRAKPAPAQLQHYQQVFDCPVLFSQPNNSLILPRDYLDIPLRQPDPGLLQTLELHAAGQVSALGDSHRFSIQVKDIIRTLLAKGITRKDMVAGQLNMSERTLQRKLQQEQTSYQKLLDEARLLLAQQYLTETLLPVDDIAMQLGFSETRSFFRSFKGWTGQTPSIYRESSSHKSG
ncbi:AraC family transcriptional regulator [Moritella sp. F3]|uniref:AraC family transcriptional regulator n=1 Tax=Moritella sp. F3 TaxID=2718882 RepID=UPI0018E1AF2C|nr:AraC family transcriptional regulator [Moritella sp. F3]GIC76315.1 transcriptional regulator [Moritella sp. F1]GIC82897.1 transcriptional regulator [Moritella sp. F3]